MAAPRFVLDSNILILHFNGRLSEPLPEGYLGCSIITEIELLSFPRLSEHESTLIRNYFSNMAVYDIDTATKETTILLRRKYRLKLPDAVIVATALSRGAVLVTNDEQLHGVPGLVCRRLGLKP